MRRPGDALRAAGRPRLPSNFRATAVRAERFIFVAAALTAAITLAPPHNPRGAEHRANQWLRENLTPGLAASCAREEGACPAVPGRKRKSRLDPRGAACVYDWVRTRDASCAGPLSPCLLSAEFGPEEKSVPLWASNTDAGAAHRSSMDLLWSRASGRLRHQNRGAHLLESTSRWSHISQSLPALQ